MTPKGKARRHARFERAAMRRFGQMARRHAQQRYGSQWCAEVRVYRGYDVEPEYCASIWLTGPDKPGWLLIWSDGPIASRRRTP